MKIKNWFKDFLKGASLGTGILPGVSVGTVGIITKIYDKLLGSINGLRKNFKDSFLTLLPIALGCVLAAGILLIAQETLYSSIPFEMTCLFSGFVLCGIPVVIFDLPRKKLSKSDIFRAILSFFIASIIGVISVISKIYWKLDMTQAFENPANNFWIFPTTLIVGFVAAVGCLLPGISGSMILFIFGLYQPVVGLIKGDNSIIHNSSRLGTGLILLGLLFIGVVAGLFAVSKAMTGLIEKHKQGTYTCIIGFILGSFVSMFVNQDIWEVYQSLSLPHLLIGLAVLLISATGFLLLIIKTYKPQDIQSE